MIVDNFAISLFQGCPAKYDLRINQGWSRVRKGPALGFGGAMHAGLAAWYRRPVGSPDRLDAACAAISAEWGFDPIDDRRTLANALRMMQAYATEYPAESFEIVGMDAGEPLIEQPFTLPTGMYLPCLDPSCLGFDCAEPLRQTNCPYCSNPLEPIEYGGIFDGLVTFGDKTYILEHKTTSMLGPTYFHQFKPNNQITGYSWAASTLSGREVSGAIVNALLLTRSSKIEFERGFTTRSTEDIKLWLEHLWHICLAIRESKRKDVWPMYTAACSVYGGCEYREVHSTPVQIERERILATDFVVEPWQHEARDEGAKPE